RVEVSSDGELLAGAGPSAPFEAGVLASAPLAFAHSGRWHLFAGENGGTASGASGLLLVRPPAPANFTVTASALEERAVTLSWFPGATGDAAGFNVYRFNEAIYDTTAHRVLTLPGSAASVTDTVPDFGTWHYVVVAYDTARITSTPSADQSAAAPRLFF